MEIPKEIENLSKKELIILILSEREKFKKHIEELEKRFLAYENAHPCQRINLYIMANILKEEVFTWKKEI